MFSIIMYFFGLIGFAAEIALTGTGESTYKKKKEMIAAREDAIEKAKQNAVYKGLTKFATEKQLKENDEKIQSEILLAAAGFVKRFDIVSEKDRNKNITIVLKAYIDEETLQKNLNTIGISSDVSSRKSIAILIDEFIQGDIAPSNEPVVAEKLEMSSSKSSKSSTVDAKANKNVKSYENSQGSKSSEAAVVARGGAAYGKSQSKNSSTSFNSDTSSASYNASSDEQMEQFSMSLTKYFPPEALKQPVDNSNSAATIARLLLGRDVRLIDSETVQKMRASMVTDNVLSLGLLPPEQLVEKALAFGTEYGFDAMMVGTTIVTRDDTSEGAGINRANATLAVRIVDTATGDIIASQVSNQNGKGTTFSQAATSSSERLGNVLGQELGDQLFQYWKKRSEKGIEITIIIQANEPSTKTKVVLFDAISAVEGAENITERKFDKKNGIIEYSVTTKRPLTEFKNDCLRAFMKNSILENIEEEKSMGAFWTYSLP